MLIQMKQALKIVTRRKEKHFIIQKVNPLGRFQSYKHIHTQKRCPKIYWTKMDRIEGRNREFNNDNRRLHFQKQNKIEDQ